MSKKKKEEIAWGGRRAGSGRLPRPDWQQITLHLKKDTIQELRQGAAKVKGEPGPRPHIGAFLQQHLERHPLPTWDEFQALKDQKKKRGWGGFRAPVIVAVTKDKKPVLPDALSVESATGRRLSVKQLVHQALQQLR
jgi:hypothetical protein